MFLWQAKQGFGEQEEEHGDGEGTPDIAGEGGIGGLAGLVEQGVSGAVEHGVELLAGEDFRVVFLENKIDESIIGGFVLRVGDLQFDASVANKLSNLKREFTSSL